MLSFDIYTFLIITVTFLLSIFIFNFIIYKPVLDFIDKRDSENSSEESAIAKNLDFAQKCNREAEELLSSTRAKCNDKLNKAISLEKVKIDDDIASKKFILNDELISYKNKLNNDKNKLKSEITDSKDEIMSVLKGHFKNV